jgi:hypothetical protein
MSTLKAESMATHSQAASVEGHEDIVQLLLRKVLTLPSQKVLRRHRSGNIWYNA